METMMLGHKRTVPLWKQKRKGRLMQERALTKARAQGADKPEMPDEAAAVVKAANRAAAEARWQAWLRGG
jgi:hypothetical protein